MVHNKKISVIIPSFNSAGTIRRCIMSVIGTRYPYLEIIVVDDVSIDESPQIVEKLCLEFPEIVKLIKQDVNGGPAKARNRGAEIAKGEYLFFLDSDTEMFPDTLQNFADCMEKADAVTGIYHYESLNKGFAQTYKALLNYYFFSRMGTIEYEVYDASRAGVKTKVFRSLGGFNENLGWGMDYENEEFGYRLVKEYKNLLDPSVVVKHEFPDWKKLTKTYFSRVSLWAEIFFYRKKFESGGVTSVNTGISTASLIISLVTVPLIAFNIKFGLIPLFFFFLYVYGYFGFLKFVFKKNRCFLISSLFLNIYFTSVIGAAAFCGICKVILGISGIKERFSGIDS